MGSFLRFQKLYVLERADRTEFVHPVIPVVLRPQAARIACGCYAAPRACVESSTMSARVLLRIALSSACSCAGTANLSSVC